MESHLSISISKSNLKRVLIILLVMVTLTETLVYKFRFEIIDHPWIKIHLAQQELLKKEWKYMILADSGSLVGIDPGAISEDLGNLSFPSCQAIGPYLLLRRYLKSNRAPQIIFFSIAPEAWSESIFFKEEFIRYTMNLDDFLTVWRDLTSSEKRAYFWVHLMPSFGNRFWIKSRLVKIMRMFVERIFSPTSPAHGNSQHKAKRRPFLTSQGFISSPNPEHSMEDAEIMLLEKQMRHQEFTFSSRNLKYFDLFVKLAKENKIQVVYFEGLVPELSYSIRETTGYNEKYSSFLEEMKKKYKFVVFDSSYKPFLPNKDFVYYYHLNREGAIQFTSLFKDKIFLKYAHENKN